MAVTATDARAGVTPVREPGSERGTAGRGLGHQGQNHHHDSRITRESHRTGHQVAHVDLRQEQEVRSRASGDMGQRRADG